MSEVIEIAELFELELELPNDKIAASSKRLVGFENRYQRLHRDLRLLADPEELRAWSRKYHHKELAVCERSRTGIPSSFSPAMSVRERQPQQKVPATGWLAKPARKRCCSSSALAFADPARSDR